MTSTVIDCSAAVARFATFSLLMAFTSFGVVA